MPTGRKLKDKPDNINTAAPLRYSQIPKPAAQVFKDGNAEVLLLAEQSGLRLGESGTKVSAPEHFSQPSFSGHQGDILRLRQ